MRLKASQVKSFREKLLREQAYECALCREMLSQTDAVLDHDHETGKVRGVIHGNCNIALGKLENAVKFRAKMSKWQFGAFARGLWMYLVKDQMPMPYHPGHLKKQCSKFRSQKVPDQISELGMMMGHVVPAPETVKNQKLRDALFKKLITT